MEIVPGCGRGIYLGSRLIVAVYRDALAHLERMPLLTRIPFEITQDLWKGAFIVHRVGSNKYS